MVLEYYRAYVIAKLDQYAEKRNDIDLYQEFYNHICNCLNYLFSEQFSIRSYDFNSY